VINKFKAQTNKQANLLRDILKSRDLVMTGALGGLKIKAYKYRLFEFEF
jgi:hypothetical protein